MQKRNVFLYFAFRPEKTLARAARYAREIQNACPDFDFAILTYDKPQKVLQTVVDLKGLRVPHFIYGQEAAYKLPYSIKIGSTFLLKPLNCDVPVLLFWKDRPHYERYWTLEDDIEYTGDFGKLIADLQKIDADLLATHVRNLPDDWDYISKFRSGINDCTVPDRCRVAFLAFHVVSNAGLAAIDEAYRQGWAGQHEMTWPAILDTAGLSVADIGGNGPYVAEGHRGRHYIDLSPEDYQKLGSFGTKHIRLSGGREREILWHPVKTFPDWARMSVKRGISMAKWLWRKYAVGRTIA